MPRHFTFRLAQAFSEALDFAEAGGKEGEDDIRLPQLRLFNDNGFGLIFTRVWHIGYYLIPVKEIPVTLIMSEFRSFYLSPVLVSIAAG